MSDFTIYVDGSCRTNTGKGGWGVVVLQSDEIVHQMNGSVDRTTNNRMELQAAIEVLKFFNETFDPAFKFTFYSDSQYLCRGMNEWVKGWKKRGWKMANGQDMKNVDLWQQLDYFNCLWSIQWKWVRGHNGDEYNELADALAKEASSESE